MKRLLAVGLLVLVSACQSPAPKETYPYGMSEKEWNELSIKDQARMRRDFYFYEKGHTSFVNPDIDIEGRKEPAPHFFKGDKKAPATPYDEAVKE